MTLRAWIGMGCVLALFAPGCGDDAGADTDTDAGGSSTGAPTTGAPTTTPPTTGTPTTDAPTTGTPTTEGPMTDPSTTAADDSSSTGGEDDSSSGDAAMGICVGFNYLGAVDQVHFPEDPGQVEVVCAPEPAPCGGEIEGTWTVFESCGYEVLPNFFDEICEGAEQQITGSQSMGTRAFNEDGTFDFDLTNTLEVDLTVDAMACAGLSCEAFADALSEEPEFDMLCEDAEGGGCSCVYTLALVEEGSGTWNTLGDSVLLTVDGELENSLEYCVEEGRLDLWQPLFSEEPNPDVTCETERDCAAELGDAFAFYGCVDPADLDER